MCLLMKKLMSEIKLGNKMKYSCKYCNFIWEGTSYTFDKVREHEKIHPENDESITLRKNKSIRCKVCNTPRVRGIDQINCDEKWECKTCGNLLDAKGCVIDHK